jgi:hypothetical protein
MVRRKLVNITGFHFILIEQFYGTWQDVIKSWGKMKQLEREYELLEQGRKASKKSVQEHLLF